MEKIILLMRSLFLLVSFYGYIRFCSKHLRPELAIGFLFCSIGSAMFLAGVLNMLSISAWLIAFAGVCLAFVSLRKKESIREICCYGTVFFLIGAVFFLWLLYGSKFTHYDNFSHWAVAPQLMIRHNRFPNFTDPNYKFQAYPLGSSVFIFYFTEITGLSAEWFQMFAQAILLLGLMSSVFVFTTRRSTVFMAIFCSVILMCSNIAFTDLLVDTLLPLIGLAGVAFCIYYRDGMLKKLLYTIPYSVFLLSVKNSGIFFVAAILGLAWHYTKSEKNRCFYRAAVLLSPFTTLLIWKIHVKRVFPDGLISKHSMSIANFSSVFQDKQPEDVITIITAILRKIFSVSNTGILLLLTAVVLWLVWKHLSPSSRNVSGMILCLILVSYVVYQIGTIGMFLFSMPQYEAVRLAGYGRYHRTILTFLAGLLLIGFLLASESIPSKKFRQLSFTVICSIVLLVALKPSVSYLFRQDLTGSERERFDALFEEYGVQPHLRYAIIVSKDRDDAGYLRYLCRYRLGAQEHEIITDDHLETADWIIFDYILFFEETDATRSFLQKHYPDITGPVVDLNQHR